MTGYAKETYVWFCIISVPIIVRNISYTLLMNNANLGKIVRFLFRLEILNGSLEKTFSNELCVFTIAWRSILESYMARSK